MKILFLCLIAALAGQAFSASIVTSASTTDDDLVISSIDKTLLDLKKLNDTVANSNAYNKKLQSMISHVLESFEQIFNPKNVLLEEVPPPRSKILSPLNATHQNKSVIMKKTTNFADEEHKSLAHSDTSENPILKDLLRKNSFEVQFAPEKKTTLSRPIVKNHFDPYSKEHEINHPLVRCHIKGIKDAVSHRSGTLKPLPKFTVEFLKPKDPITERPRYISSSEHNQADSQSSKDITEFSWIKNAIDRQSKTMFLDAMFNDNKSGENFGVLTPGQQQFFRQQKFLQQQKRNNNN